MSIPGFCCSENNCFTDSQCTVGSYYCSTLPGYCLSNYNSQPVIGRCPLFKRDLDLLHRSCFNAHEFYSTYIQQINDYISWEENRPSPHFLYTGRFNGACKSNNCVPINSPYFQCTNNGSVTINIAIDGTNKGLVINLLIVFTIEIVPVTILIILIIVLNIKLTNGSLNGYVFFCRSYQQFIFYFISLNGFIRS